MNSDDLLNIINIIIKNEEKLEESPNEIYDLFKKHGYEGDIETLKLDLKNLLNDVIKSDEELSKVAGGKVSRLAAGAVAALTCLPMNSFASGTANTSRNKQSNVNKITDTIKSGAKKVGDATKEYVIEPAKDAAKTIARNPGKSAAVTTALAIYGLLSGLAGKKLASPPKVDKQGMTEDEIEIVDKASKVFQQLATTSCDEVTDQELNWNLSKITGLPEELTDKTIKIGELTGELMPGTPHSTTPTTAYISARTMLVDFEKTFLNTLEKKKQQIEEKLKKNNEELEKKKNNDELENEKKTTDETLKQIQEKLDKIQTEYDDYKSAADAQLQVLKNKNPRTAEFLKEANIVGVCSVSKMLSEKPGQISGNQNNYIRKKANELLGTINGMPKLKNLPSKWTQAKQDELTLGDAYQYVLPANKPPQILVPGLGTYLPDLKLVGTENIPTDLYTAKLASSKFWINLLTSNLTSDAKKGTKYTIGMEHPIIVRTIIYCLLMCHYNQDLWHANVPLITGIQTAIQESPDKSVLLQTCLATINIKYEHGFLKWIDPNLK